MEIIVILAVLGFAAWWIFRQADNATKQAAENLAKQAEETVKQEVVAVKEVLDVNKDGKVNLDDAKEVVKRGRKKKSS